MGVLNIGNNGTAVDINGTDISNFFDTPYANIAESLPIASKLAYILAIVAGALFLLGAVLALLNLGRDKKGVHLLIILFGLERVATYVIRAMMYHDKFQQRKYYEVFEILETAGFALLIVILWHLWSAFGTKKEDGSTKKLIRSCNCLFQLLATIITAGAAAAFAAGAVLQDRANQDSADRGYKLRKAATIGYGAVLAVFDFFCIFLLCRRGARATAPGLFIAGLLLSAKAGFMIYAVWHAPERYYQNKFWYPLGVLTELLALLIIVMPGFVRRGMRSGPPIPVYNDNGQYVVGSGQPHQPTYNNGPAIAPTYNK